MITYVEVRNPQGDLLTLQLEDPNNGYLVKEIEGLDPVPATIVSSSFAEQDGEQYQASHREKRNIVFKLGYDPDYTSNSVRSLRSDLYKFFMPKAQVRLRFFSDDLPPVRIEGRVEDMDAPLFSSDPSANISVLCLLPDFFSPDEKEIEGVTTALDVETPAPYTGSIETGIIFRLFLNRSVSELFIFHKAPDNTIRTLQFAHPLLSGDTLEISSVSGSKHATLTRAASDSSVLYGVSPTSNWIQLLPGNNTIRVQVDGAAIPWEILYTDKFGGL